MIQALQCPVCRKGVVPKSDNHPLPFCSERCRDIDLLRWSKGSYAITEDVDPEVVEFLKHDPNITVEEES